MRGEHTSSIGRLSRMGGQIDENDMTEGAGKNNYD